MNEQLTPDLQAWLKGTAAMPEDARASAGAVMARVAHAGQRGRWWPLSSIPIPTPGTTTSGPLPAGGSTMFSALKFVAAGVIVALFGGFLLMGVLTTPSGEEAAPAAVVDSPSPDTSSTEPAVSATPSTSPITTLDPETGMLVEEVEPGVVKVHNDGFRDTIGEDGPRLGNLEYGADGSVWAWTDGGMFQPGRERSVVFSGKRSPDGNHVIAADGSVWSFDYEVWWHDARGELQDIWERHSCMNRFVTFPDGSVWLGSCLEKGYGLARLDGDERTVVYVPFRVGGNPPSWGITDGHILVQGKKALYRYDGDEWSVFDRPKAAKGKITAPDGTFWSHGQTGDGADVLFRLDGTDWKRWEATDAWPRLGGELRATPDGRMLSYGGEEELEKCRGVAVFDESTWVRHLRDHCVLHAAMEADGRLWVLAKPPKADATDSEELVHWFWLEPAELYLVLPETAG